ncbi:MAG: hypothetical protein LAT58_12870, partial [Opitutales bacterium]|nr:hypothetical protein [Opitutales bacterium]
GESGNRIAAVQGACRHGRTKRSVGGRLSFGSARLGMSVGVTARKLRGTFALPVRMDRLGDTGRIGRGGR